LKKGFEKLRPPPNRTNITRPKLRGAEDGERLNGFIKGKGGRGPTVKKILKNNTKVTNKKRIKGRGTIRGRF